MNVTPGRWRWPIRVALELQSYDPTLIDPVRLAVAGTDEPLRAWLQAWQHTPDPNEIRTLEALVETLETANAPDLLLEKQRQMLYHARHGPVAGKNIREANPEWLFRWVTQIVPWLDLGSSWDVLHYGLDPNRRGREAAVHWRFLDTEPSPFDLALFGRRKSPLLLPHEELPPEDVDPEEAADQATGWQDLFRPYNGYDNDPRDTKHVAQALEATSEDAFTDIVAGPLPDHVYGAGAHSVEAAQELRSALITFYQTAANAGWHVRTSWRT